MSFNPEFSFSFDGDGDYGSALSDEKTKRQTPWDFSSACHLPATDGAAAGGGRGERAWGRGG